jgi:hypothetical protein
MSTGLQTIIDNCNGIKFNRRNVVGIQYTRNEIPRVSATPTRNPWKITVDMPNKFRYSQARALLEELDTLDTTTPQIISFGNLPAMDWIFKYQGSMTSGQIAAVTVQTYVGETLTLTGLPAISATAYLFKKNDLIQISGHPYPFTSTTDVLRGAGSTVVVTTSRPNIITDSVVGSGIVVGSTCEFNMFCPNMPVYKLTPGGYVGYGGATTNNALIEWSDSFFLYEFVGDA